MAEKDLRAHIETVQRRRRQRPADGTSSNDFDLVRSLLPFVLVGSASDDEDDSETDDILRETSLLLLRLLYMHACSQLQSLDQEMELLRNAPPLRQPAPAVDECREKVTDQEAMWRLDPTPRVTGREQLLDSSGKVRSKCNVASRSLPAFTASAAIHNPAWGHFRSLPFASTSVRSKSPSTHNDS